MQYIDIVIVNVIDDHIDKKIKNSSVTWIENNIFLGKPSSVQKCGWDMK